MISLENLYQPDKYKVILGEGKSIGFCTLWNEPEKIIHENPEILEKVAIVGTLYSRQGVNIILRNLALNPQIHTLYLLSIGTLSCSPFGVSGKDILLTLWKEGVDENGMVASICFALEKEIDPSVVNIIRENVSLVEITETNIKMVIDSLANEGKDDYMKPVRFKDAVPQAIEMFPSEKVGFLVRGKTVLDTWVKVVDRIMRYGTIKTTQYGSNQRELIGVTWVIEDEDPDNPYIETDLPDNLKQTIGLNMMAITHYREIFLSPHSPEGVTYTYGNRLMQYPGASGHIDQIEEVIIKELRASKDSRRAIATTIVPEIDKNSKEPPCISLIQALQINNSLHLLVTARSHDIFKAAIPNAFGLRALQKSIANRLGMTLGSLQITSQSAHIYESEWDDAKKLVSCLIWEREPHLVFDPALHTDPRGMFLLEVRGDEIRAHFKTPNGDDLLTISAKTAKEVAMKIGQLDIISRPDHLLDIGMELQKAGIALELKIPYTQDKPLLFEGNTAVLKGEVCIQC